MANAQLKIKQTAGRDTLGDFAPEFAHVNDDILFCEVCSRKHLLSLRDRSVVTLVSQVSLSLADSSLKYQWETARKNGVTKVEIAEILTHAAFYVGWRKAGAVFRMAQKVWATVFIPAGVKHWHGAAPGSWVSHLAIAVSGENTGNEWLEPVTDAEYTKFK